MPTKEYLKTHKQVVIPISAHEWLIKRAGEIEAATGRRVSLGDVFLNVIRAIEDYEDTGGDKTK
jgi:hypothetical protein